MGSNWLLARAPRSAEREVLLNRVDAVRGQIPRGPEDAGELSELTANRRETRKLDTARAGGLHHRRQPDLNLDETDHEGIRRYGIVTAIH